MERSQPSGLLSAFMVCRREAQFCRPFALAHPRTGFGTTARSEKEPSSLL
jgi:hypothetical protein